jgi:hypothetical protein
MTDTSSASQRTAIDAADRTARTTSTGGRGYWARTLATTFARAAVPSGGVKARRPDLRPPPCSSIQTSCDLCARALSQEEATPNVSISSTAS